ITPGYEGQQSRRNHHPRQVHLINTWLAKIFDTLGMAYILSLATGELLGLNRIFDTTSSTDGNRATTWTAYIRDTPVEENVFFNGKRATVVNVTEFQSNGRKGKQHHRGQK
ncbi:hypothetical protein AnigIFM62618_005947, partial [Aspergillus niger]